MAEHRIAIGVPTYKSWQRVEYLLTTIKTLTNFDGIGEVPIVVIDDGTVDTEQGSAMVDKLKGVCDRFQAGLIVNQKNRGIPYVWNRLTEYYDADYIMLFNDDAAICNPNWLKMLLYFLENNAEVGTVGFPLIHMDPVTAKPMERIDPSQWGQAPGRVGAAVGCCFAFRKDCWREIRNDDGSIGFAEYLVSFHEETMFGMECAKRGWRSYMLNCPPMEHWRSRTFSTNPELQWCQFDERWISKEDYARISSKCKHTVDFWNAVGDGKSFMTEAGIVDRMSWSRTLFLKHFDVPEEQIDNPQIAVHNRFVDPLPSLNVKWLDSELQPKEAVLP